MENFSFRNNFKIPDDLHQKTVTVSVLAKGSLTSPTIKGKSKVLLHMEKMKGESTLIINLELPCVSFSPKVDTAAAFAPSSDTSINTSFRTGVIFSEKPFHLNKIHL